MADGQINLYVIDNGVLLTFLHQPTMLAEFDCLKQAADRLANRTRPGCGRCGGKSRKDDSVRYDDLKLCLANSSAAKKRRLKTLLNARQIRMRYRTGGGKVISLTF